MGYRLQINFSDGDTELVDEVFDTEEDAIAEYETWLENWGTGRDVLKAAGEEYSDADIEDYDIWEE